MNKQTGDISYVNHKPVFERLPCTKCPIFSPFLVFCRLLKARERSWSNIRGNIWVGHTCVTFSLSFALAFFWNFFGVYSRLNNNILHSASIGNACFDWQKYCRTQKFTWCNTPELLNFYPYFSSSLLKVLPFH